MDPVHRGMLAAELGLDEAHDVFEVDGMLGAARPDGDRGARRSRRCTIRRTTRSTTRACSTTRNIFHVIRDAGPILLQHPYESFAHVGRALPARGRRGSRRCARSR